MLNLFKKKKNTVELQQLNEQNINRNNDGKEETITASVGLSATESAQISTQQAQVVFSKPSDYTGNRHLYDSGVAKQNIKIESFTGGTTVRDPYTQEELELHKADAIRKYGNNWADHVAEGDHITPIEKIFEDHGASPWLRNEDIKNLANSKENLQTVSRKFNNAKRSRTNEEFVTDDAYLDKTCIKLSEPGKQHAITSGRKSLSAINKKAAKAKLTNAIATGHHAGMSAAQQTGVMAATISSIGNITAVIKGEKKAADALVDVGIDTCKASATGYIMGHGLTVASQTLSSSSSQFVRALSASNVPGKVITAVLLTGNTLMRYGNGEISTQECIIELGESELNIATAGYSMTVGQALIPIPVVGAAVGAFVGTILTSSYYNKLVTTLQVKELEHLERLAIIAECDAVAEQEQAFRQELEKYLVAYFKDYRHCFDDALFQIQTAFEMGDADGIISGANTITRKLGGRVACKTVEDFKHFLDSDTIDLL